MSEYHISTQVLHGNGLFSGKLYTAGQNFTRPPVVTVVTNINSGSILYQLVSLIIYYLVLKARAGESVESALSALAAIFLGS